MRRKNFAIKGIRLKNYSFPSFFFEFITQKRFFTSKRTLIICDKYHFIFAKRLEIVNNRQPEQTVFKAFIACILCIGKGGKLSICSV